MFHKTYQSQYQHSSRKSHTRKVTHTTSAYPPKSATSPRYFTSKEYAHSQANMQGCEPYSMSPTCTTTAANCSSSSSASSTPFSKGESDYLKSISLDLLWTLLGSLPGPISLKVKVFSTYFELRCAALALLAPFYYTTI